MVDWVRPGEGASARSNDGGSASDVRFHVRTHDGAAEAGADDDADLLEAAESISWLVCGLVRNELRSRLRPVFSNLKFESVQSVAYTMPSVRPGNSNALHDLAQHYTPDQVRINLIASSIRRQDNDEEIAIKLAKHQICRWLKDRFKSLEITSIRYLTQD